MNPIATSNTIPPTPVGKGNEDKRSPISLEERIVSWLNNTSYRAYGLNDFKNIVNSLVAAIRNMESLNKSIDVLKDPLDVVDIAINADDSIVLVSSLPEALPWHKVIITKAELLQHSGVL